MGCLPLGARRLRRAPGGMPIRMGRCDETTMGDWSPMPAPARTCTDRTGPARSSSRLARTRPVPTGDTGASPSVRDHAGIASPPDCARHGAPNDVMTTQNGRAFNEWLRAQLKAKKMSQRQLAQQSGVDHSTISRLIRGDRMPSLGHGDEAGPRPPRAARRRRHAAVPRPGRLRGDEPDRARRVRAAGRRAPERAAGPPDHGVLPRRPDAPLRPRVPAIRAFVQPSAGAPARALCAGWPGPGRGRCRTGEQPVALADGRRPSDGPIDSAGPGDPRRARPTRPRPTTSFSRARPGRPPRPGLGDSECRRLGRRHSHFVLAAVDGCRAWTTHGGVAACAPRSRPSEARSLRCSAAPCADAPMRDERSRAVAPDRRGPHDRRVRGGRPTPSGPAPPRTGRPAAAAARRSLGGRLVRRTDAGKPRVLGGAAAVGADRIAEELIAEDHAACVPGSRDERSGNRSRDVRADRPRAASAAPRRS